jgi:hypothetical protein
MTFYVKLLANHDLEYQLMTTVCAVRVHGWYDRSAEDAYSSTAPDPTFAYVGGTNCPTLDFLYFFLLW